MHDFNTPPALNSPVVFKKVSGDPIGVKCYTLSNGLKLFLSVNKSEPRVFTEIAVRVGSKHDPAETTGLAHYFEHMMFKGTDRLGTLDWENEKILLDQIEALFEAHRKETDPDKKKALYTQIDRLSFEAAKFASANEYDKLASAIGANHTNAYTWVEQTVYVNDIPANELERWFKLECERFRRPVLRLFHTELETVFEEYNISQDRDFRKTMKAIQESLTPTHPYGTQTTLGRGEDLKNPSQTNIYRFFDTYYVPNNMAIIMAGDFDPEEVVRLAEKYFGAFKSKPLPKFKFAEQPMPSQRIHRDVWGAESPWLEIAWRSGGAASPDALILPIIAGVLHNYQAGLFDLNIMQRQQLLEAYAYPRIYEDFGSLILQAKPREGQSLEEVERILMDQIEALRRGDFEDWLPEAVVKDLKLSEIRSFEKNQGRTSAVTNAYISGVEWKDAVGKWKKWAKIGKKDIVEFARQHLRNDNCAVVYKHTGEDPSTLKVEKPAITPIEMNRTDMSAFARNFLNQSTPDIQPEFLQYRKVMKTSTLFKGVKLYTVRDNKSGIFRLHYCFDMGKTAERKLSLLAAYWPFLALPDMSSTQVQQAFYRLGLSCSAECRDDHFYLSLSGLEESVDAGLELMERLIREAVPNEEAYKNLVVDILQRRENDKMDKRVILSKAMTSWAKYGALSPFSDKIPAETLQSLAPHTLTELLKSLPSYPHEIFYCGARPAKAAREAIRTRHIVEQNLTPLLPAKKFPELSQKKEDVFFVHFPMVQVEILLMSKGTPRFNLDEFVFMEWYNQYFGYGLSSIVFQEIRESKALAYTAYAFADAPGHRKKAHYLKAYVGTQPDKLYQAIPAFQDILHNMPVSIQQIESARQSVLKQIAAGRTPIYEVYWNWRTGRDRGHLNRDLREAVYKKLESVSPQALIDYQKQFIQHRKFTWMILGDRDRIDFSILKKIGKVKELTLTDIFGY